MNGEFEKISEAAGFLRERAAAPRALVVLGTGLGGFGARLTDTVEIPYEDVPHFPESTSPGHSGQLVFGRSGDVPAMVMEGRFHHYEGYTLHEIARPIRVARMLGAQTLLITAAVGGMNPRHALGDIVVVDDHINLIGSPLRGVNDERIGPRFPDMSAPYDAELIAAAEAGARAAGFRVPRACLAGVPGPQLETRAEYRLLRQAGADVVGMSTVPECIAAVHAGLRVGALAVITDLCLPDALKPAVVEEIIAVANAAAPRLEQLLVGLLDHA